MDELENLETVKTIAQKEKVALVDKNNQLNKELEVINTRNMAILKAASSMDSIM